MTDLTNFTWGFQDAVWTAHDGRGTPWGDTMHQDAFGGTQRVTVGHEGLEGFAGVRVARDTGGLRLVREEDVDLGQELQEAAVPLLDGVVAGIERRGAAGVVGAPEDIP